MESVEDRPVMKRKYDGSEKGTTSITPQFMPMFEIFKEELDRHHDRRERIIKASRDITASSKKIIFTLQRVRTLKQSISPKIANETQERFSAIIDLFVSICPDLEGTNAWRYQRQISSGVQEFIEALSLEHYLRTQSLISRDMASTILPDGVNLSIDDYVLGVFDLVGELMRFAITIMAADGLILVSKDASSNSERTILTDMRSLRTQFEALDTISGGSTGLGKDVEKKMQVMKTCVEKVETAVYGMIIRGRERPKGWFPDIPGDRPVPDGY